MQIIDGQSRHRHRHLPDDTEETLEVSRRVAIKFVGRILKEESESTLGTLMGEEASQRIIRLWMRLADLSEVSAEELLELYQYTITHRCE